MNTKERKQRQERKGTQGHEGKQGSENRAHDTQTLSQHAEERKRRQEAMEGGTQMVDKTLVRVTFG